MQGRQVELKSGSGATFSGYLRLPERTPARGIVLLQEIFGVNAAMRDLADRFAALGYVVIAPDLFWRQNPGVQLDSASASDREEALKLFKGLDESLAVEDAAAALGYLRALPECAGKMAAIGFCLGGKLAYLMAARTDVDASVSYYGIGIDKALNEAATIRKPLLLHLAEQDRLCPPEAQRAINQGLAPYSQLVTTHVYTGVGHAFARIGGAEYDAAAARLAQERTLEFLAQL
jgi:carboxymethylenebutenolidase